MIRFDDVHSIKLLMRACQVQFVPTLHHAIADYDRDDHIKGGVLYTDYYGGSCQMHVAGFQKGWASKSLLWLAFDYPFNQLGVRKVFGFVPEWNWRARNFDNKLGFKLEYTCADVFDRTDGVNGMHLMSMTRDECRWLRMKMPFIEFAPQLRTSEVTSTMALAALPTYGGIH